MLAIACFEQTLRGPAWACAGAQLPLQCLPVVALVRLLRSYAELRPDRTEASIENPPPDPTAP